MSAYSWYCNNEQKFHEFLKILEPLICDLLASAGLDFKVDSRVKEIDSFTEKASKAKYQDPAQEIFDLVGVRIIVPFEDDMARVSEILTQYFVLNEEESVDKSQALDTDRVGYRGDHKILRICETRASLPEWNRFSDLYFEAQIRTTLQHAWAQNEHKLVYKSETPMPDSFKRTVNRISGLLETADADFVRLRKESIEHTRAYNEKARCGELDQDVRLADLVLYVAEGQRIKDLCDMFRIARIEPGFQAEYLAKDLLKDMKRRGLHTISDLDNFLAVLMEHDKILNYVKAILRAGEADFEEEDDEDSPEEDDSRLDDIRIGCVLSSMMTIASWAPEILDTNNNPAEVDGKFWKNWNRYVESYWDVL